MKNLSQLALIVGLISTLTACGGSSGGDPAPAQDTAPATNNGDTTNNAGNDTAPATTDPAGTTNPDPTTDPGTTNPSTNSSPKALTIVDATGEAASVPRYIADGTNASLQYWVDDNGAVVQSLYTSAADAVTVRVMHDPTTGFASKIIDTQNGGYVVVKNNGNDSVDFLEYDGADGYLQGWSVYLEANRLYIADLLARPAFLGQLRGSLNGDLAIGSFAAVTSVEQQLANSTPATADIYAYIHALVGALDGTVPSTPADQIDEAELETARALLPVIGLLMIDQSNATLLSHGVYGAAGAAVSLAAFAPAAIADVVAQGAQAPAGSGSFLAEQINLALSYLVDETMTQVAGFWAAVVANTADTTDYTNATLSAALTDLGGTTAFADYNGDVGTLLAAADEPQPTSGVTVETPVSGQAALPNSTDNSKLDVFTLAGSITANGILELNGRTADGSATITISGTVGATGLSATTFVSGGNSGDVSGSENPVGACNAGAVDGVDGTYTFAHYVGAGYAFVDFNYATGTDADSFGLGTFAGERTTLNSVATAEGASATETFFINNEPVVFVSVASPTDAQWSYELNCSPPAVAPTSNSTETESNNTVSSADSLPFNDVMTTTVNSASDKFDWFYITVRSDDTYYFNLVSSTYQNGGTPNNLDLIVYGSDGRTKIAVSTGGVGAENVAIPLTVGTTGYYWVEVRATNTGGNNDRAKLLVLTR